MMFRILTFSCLILAVAAFAGMTVNPDVKISSSIPQLINPGDEFMVRLSIDKGNLKKGAVLQQVLPEGFTATEIQNENALFYFENQMLRMVWGKLPEKSNLVIAYKVKASENIEGFKKLSGTFIYEQNNGTAQVSISPNYIFVSNEYPVSNTGVSEEHRGNLKMKRSITPRRVDDSDGFRITMEVQKENESGFATWIDQIPKGYRVEVNQAENAIFSLNGNTARFFWNQMPEGDSWTFSYSIFPELASASHAIPDVQGIMIYGDAAKVKTCIPDYVGQESFAANALSRQEKNLETNKTQNNSANTGGSILPDIQRGIYYRVQIAATKQSPVRDADFFQKRYNIHSAVDMIEQDGWRKYCIGNFTRAEPARTYAIETRGLIPGAFVVAYRDGQRIPVAEAMESLALSQ